MKTYWWMKSGRGWWLVMKEDIHPTGTWPKTHLGRYSHITVKAIVWALSGATLRYQSLRRCRSFGSPDVTAPHPHRFANSENKTISKNWVSHITFLVGNVALSSFPQVSFSPIVCICIRVLICCSIWCALSRRSTNSDYNKKVKGLKCRCEESFLFSSIVRFGS